MSRPVFHSPVAVSAESALAKLRRGALRVRTSIDALGRTSFEVIAQEAPVCPPPCSTKLVRGICPACGKAISLQLGEPVERTPRKATEPSDTQFCNLLSLAGL